jgi:DNA-binding transcriptional MerR regulator
VHRVTGMNAASYQEIAAVLGDVDDLIVQRIADTGASLDEIGEALDQLEDQLQWGEEERMPTSPRVAQVRSILEELVDDLADEDYERTFPAA